MLIKKRTIWIAGGVVILVLALLIMPKITGNFLFFGQKEKEASTHGQQQQLRGEVKQVVLTKDNFHLFLAQQPIVSELPEEAVLSLRLYNFDSGVRQWDKSYIIKKGSVSEGTAQNPDFDIIIKSSYIYDAARDLCGAVKKAQANGDFAADTNLGTTALLWKYKSMMKYRDCFGF